MFLTYIVLLFIILLVIITRRRILLSKKRETANSNTIYINAGDHGEKIVSDILAQLPNKYHIFNDVYIEFEGKSSQIDHVVISQYGVFVIETKNYSGLIYGNEKAEQWTQNLKGKNYNFYNPIKQNLSHLFVIKKTLSIAQSSIIPIVVFLDKAKLYCNTTNTVLYAHQLVEHILSYSNIAFTADGVERLSQKLNQNITTDTNREQNHITSVRRSITDRNILIENKRCPHCNGNLIERQGKYGRFLGCSNYPYCKFTKHL